MFENNDIYSEFTENNYRTLIELAKQKLKFRFFSSRPLKGKEILLRHDVDFSPQRARALARIENEVKIGATYFFRVRGADYSILDSQVQRIIHEITGLGHEIGLHFESEDLDISEELILVKLQNDKNLFELITGINSKVFSFHNPTKLMMTMRNTQYSEMINAYAKIHFNLTNYVSDSNGYWRFRSFKDVLIDPNTKKLQVLIHPEWWTPEPLSPRERIWRAHIGRANNAHQRYIELLEFLGRTDQEK